MDANKMLLSVATAVVVSMLGWSAKTTLELQLAVQRLEIILLDDAMTK